MKLFYVLLLTLPLLGHTYPYPYPAKADKAISLEDVTLDAEHAETSSDSQITKRSGSFDYVAHLKGGLLSSIGHASASIASGSSGSSSGGGGGGGGYKYEAHGNAVAFDPWSFKKSVLNTIFQAVKAITGGVTALKGQLIKGSGYALSASGNLVAASGDKVTDVGKAIINSAQLVGPSYGHSGASVAVVHPFAKFSSLSGASSGGSSGGKGGGTIHTDTITTYEIPAGQPNYGPPSKPPTYSSATHQYLPPAGAGGYTGGGAPFSGGGHAAFEAPPSNYLQAGTGYGHDGHDDFNIYGRHKKLTDAEARKAAAQLQEILGLLPNGKTEFTASKTVVLNSNNNNNNPGEINVENVDLQTYGLPNDLGPLESLSHTESITAAYGRPPPAQLQENPSDIYRQMAKKQSPEEVYIQKHPNEGYDYRPTKAPEPNQFKYNNYHAANNALRDLTPIIAALEVTKRRSPASPGATVSTQYAVEKSVHKIPPTGSTQFNYLPPVVQKSKYTYFDPAANKRDDSGLALPPPPPPVPQPPVYVTNSYTKVRRHASPPPAIEAAAAAVAAATRKSKKAPLFKAQDYEIQDPLLFNRLFML